MIKNDPEVVHQMFESKEKSTVLNLMCLSITRQNQKFKNAKSKEWVQCS